ncbi:SWI/SNF-related matrix-associated actin-dependent regulator 1 of chromatin subfamily A [Virgibacillus halotolerans]|uniref:DEAD/DEAH box helicase n=1 Tax=Virgibacillus halotolerans TaxID=1071053 RepID=UPI00196192C5|nr:DEAD/DEAH box helicase [Virgibacillus halotolerans]MBM7598156.1 SWI/SNF-related matrix-associated actin-dependent regulator 1 of chromatin subfamily A [Virgibacillus halotolerans]
MLVKDHDKSKAIIETDYNYELYREIKQVPESNYNMELDAWVLDKKYINALLNNLKNMNLSVKNTVDHTRQIGYCKEVLSETVKTIKLSVVKENKKTIVVNFDFDYGVLNTIKMIEGSNRRFNGKDKSWAISKDELQWLHTKLDELKYVDTSDLNQFISCNSQPEISLGDFPKMDRTPFDFQIDVANQMLKEKKIINGLEAGLGKTTITVMVTEKIQSKTVVICPASVKRNWEKEIRIVNPDADVAILNGKDEYKTAQYLILNYDILDRFYMDIKNDNFETLIFDEAHKLRGITGKGTPSSKRAKFGMALTENMEYVFPLTATPFINQTKDIFNLLSIIDNSMANNWYAFANTYCGAENNGFGTSYNGSSNQSNLFERLYPHGMIRLRTEDHIDLPERIRNFIPLDINLKQYEAKIQKYMDERDSYEDNGQHLVMFGAARRLLAKEKAKHAVTMVKDLLEQNKSVVVLSNYTDVVESIANKFKEDAVIIDGSKTDKQRQDSVDLFQDGIKKVLVGNIDAAGEGITLTKSQHMIVVDMHWSPVFMKEQMEKRIHRISQTEPANIHYLYAVGAKIDERMVEMAEKKMNDASMILDGAKESFVDELIKSL